VVALSDPFATMLHNWQNFYLLAGGAAATLIGLMFVALSLASGEIIDQTSRSDLRAWVDPTLINFANVLISALVLVVPTVSSNALGVFFILAGAISTGRSLELFFWRRQHEERPLSLHDWQWRILLPFASHLIQLLAGVSFLRGSLFAFVWAAFASASLLMAGIRNAWDLALWLAAHRGIRVDSRSR
jgi:hypothetical protein